MQKFLLILLLSSALVRQSTAAVAFGSTRDELIKVYGPPIKDVDPALIYEQTLPSGETAKVSELKFSAKTSRGEAMEVECTMGGATCFIVRMLKYDKSHHWQKFDQAEIESILNEYKHYMVTTYGNRTVDEWIDVENKHSYWVMPLTGEPKKMRAMRLTTDTFDVIQIAFYYEPEKASTSSQEIKERENAHAMSMIDWEAFIRKDSKLSTVTALLGKPDRIDERDGIKVYGWYHKLDLGTKNMGMLHLLVAPYRGEVIVVGAFENYTTKAIMMPWSQKVLDASQKGG